MPWWTSAILRHMPATKILLLLGALFFLFETVLHAFGVPILQHDKIFLFTHDRYIALYALTMAGIMTLTASDVRKYQHLFVIVMASIALGIANAMLIARTGGYEVLFPPATEVDGQLSGLGIAAIVWYVTVWSAFFYERKRVKPR